MSTRAYDNLRRLCVGIEGVFPSAVCAGIAGDARHRRRGGYHQSRTDNPARNYSIVRTADGPGQGPDDAASAFDISMDARDMVTATQRLARVWANAADPRRKYLNAFNGWLGTGDAQRYDMITLAVKRASPDHKWHIHVEVRRRFVLSAVMVKAVLSALRGESVTAYLVSIGVTPDPKPSAAAPRPVVAPRYPGHVMRYGNRLPDAGLKQWQTRMYARGWKSIGVADGLFGARTLSVVRRLQANCKVPVDGEIGPKTWPLPWRPIG
jgi:hypothetical protein